jgi:hypothetical protein
MTSFTFVIGTTPFKTPEFNPEGNMEWGVQSGGDVWIVTP